MRGILQGKHEFYQQRGSKTGKRIVKGTIIIESLGTITYVVILNWIAKIILAFSILFQPFMCRLTLWERYMAVFFLVHIQIIF